MDDRKELSAPKGMNDILPGAAEPLLDSELWQHFIAVTAHHFESFGFRRVWLPAVENTALFARSIGAETDIVAKEMFSFEDRGGRPLTLRPEGTASAVRAYIEHRYPREAPQQRWWYFGPMFRGERPAKGRYRQFYQVGVEMFGAAAPTADAELLHALWQWFQKLGLSGITVRINSLGDAWCRERYRASLQAYLRHHENELCDDSKRRIDTNPLRVLDCKRDGCKRVASGAPDILEALSDDSRRHFDRVLELVAELGIPVIRDPCLVRGLDYYTGTVFELTTDQLGAQDALVGGGRYDDLVRELGGPPTPAIGFAAGVERIAELLARHRRPRQGPDLYVIPMPGTEVRALQIADAVRALGSWRVEVDVAGGRLKRQLKRADRSGARAALVLGDEEIASGRAKLRDLGVSSEVDIDLDGAALHTALGSLFSGREPNR
ncbi:MAG: histidine--tRNA ligase [Myxococcota bacterium]